MVDIASIILIMSIFGPHVALIYTVVGLVIAVAGGTVIQHLHMDDQVADFVRGEAVDAVQAETMTKQERATYALGQTAETFKKVFPFILLGVAIGALIHNWIPQDIVEAVLGDGNRLPSCSRRSSALPSTPTSSAPSRSPRRSSARAWDSAPSSRS